MIIENRCDWWNQVIIEKKPVRKISVIEKTPLDTNTEEKRNIYLRSLKSLFYINTNNWLELLHNFSNSHHRQHISIKTEHFFVCFSFHIVSLIHSFPMNPFSTHWKHQKTVRFSDFFSGRERVHWKEMG